MICFTGALDIQQGKEVNAAQWEIKDKQWELHVSVAGGEATHSSILLVDKVWCAYGCKRGLRYSPLLSKLQA